MASANFPIGVGGDGSTVTDDANPVTGLAGGGHRQRFVPALAQTVAVANFVSSTAVTVAANEASALASKIAAAASEANSLLYATNSTNAAAAALISQQQAAISAASAANSLAATLAAAGLSGAKAYASRALAVADFANQTNNQVVFIAVDESNGNQGTYNRASGTPVTSLVFLRFHEFYTSPSTAIASDSVQNTITKLLVAQGLIPAAAPSLTLGA